MLARNTRLGSRVCFAAHIDSKSSSVRWLVICEYCDLATLLVLRLLCRPLKQDADIRIGITSHLPMPEVEYRSRTSLGGRFSRRELSTSLYDYDQGRRKSITLEEGWSTDLTTLDAAMKKALSYADPGGQLSWAEYDEEWAWELMKDRRWVDVEDFASDCEREVYLMSEIGWRVMLSAWTAFCSRRDVLQVVRDYGGDNRFESDFSPSEDSEDSSIEPDGDDETNDDCRVAIFQRVWCLLLEQPQTLVYVRIRHDYRHTDWPSGGSDECVFIRTSQGKDFQLHISCGFKVL